MTFHVYKDRRGEWRWYLQAANGRKLADGGDGYLHKQDCLAGIKLVKGAGRTPIHES